MSAAPDPAVLAAFVALRERLATPERWTQNTDARNRTGWPVSADAPTAYYWCLQGAVYSLRMRQDVRRLIFNLLEAEAELELTRWNDDPGRTHAEVLALIDAAEADYRAGVVA